MGSGLGRCPPDARRKLRFERNELVRLNVAQAVIGMLLVPSRHAGCADRFDDRLGYSAGKAGASAAAPST